MVAFVFYPVFYPVMDGLTFGDNDQPPSSTTGCLGLFGSSILYISPSEQCNISVPYYKGSSFSILCSREGIRGCSSTPVCVLVNPVVSIPCGRDWSVVSPDLDI